MATTAAHSLVDEFMPVYDVSDAVAVTVNAPADATWRALIEVDFLEVGRRKPVTALLRLRELATMPLGEGGWVVLGDRPEDEIALGLVGKFWQPVITFKAVPAEHFVAFAEPGFAKTVYSLTVRPISGQRTLLTATMRTATTDEHARRWFGRYWTLGVGSGAHVLVESLLEIARDQAEASASWPS